LSLWAAAFVLPSTFSCDIPRISTLNLLHRIWGYIRRRLQLAVLLLVMLASGPPSLNSASNRFCYSLLFDSSR
jgi:hypothetical protein